MAEVRGQARGIIRGWRLMVARQLWRRFAPCRAVQDQPNTILMFNEGGEEPVHGVVQGRQKDRF